MAGEPIQETIGALQGSGPPPPQADNTVTLPDVNVYPDNTPPPQTIGQAPQNQPGATIGGNLTPGGAFDLAGPNASGVQSAPPPETQEAKLDQVPQDVARKWLAAGYTPEQVAGALGGISQEAPGYNPKAQNPTSGATGLYQHLGSRENALQDHLNKTNSDWFDHNAQTDFALSELSGQNPLSNESAADARIRKQTTPGGAALAYARGFMRPGPNTPPGYYQKAQAEANRVYPDVKALANEKPATQPAAFKPIPDWAPEADHPAHQQLPTGLATPAASPIAAQTLKDWDAHTGLTLDGSTYGVPPSPNAIAQLTHAASYLPAMAWSAVAASLGWRADALNAVRDVQNAATTALGAPNQAPHLGETPQEMTMRQAYSSDQAQRGQYPPATGGERKEFYPENPVQGPEVPAPGSTPQSLGQSALNVLKSPTTENFRTLGGAITPPALPSEKGDTDTVSRYLETFGEPAMMVAGAGFPKVMEGTAGLARGQAIKKVIGGTSGNAAIGASIFGLGNQLGQDITGSNGAPAATQASGLGISLGLEATRLALFKGGTLGYQGTPALFQKYIGGKVGPGPNLLENVQDRTMAGANLRAYDPNSVVPGFETTGAAASGDNGAQALFNLHRSNNDLVAGRFSKLLSNNDQAIDNASQGIVPGSGGVPSDAVSYFQKEMQDDREAMDQHVIDAGREAHDNYQAVAGHLGLPDSHVEAQEHLGNEQNKALRAADDNLKAYTDWRWQNARAAGVDEVPMADKDANELLHGPLQKLMSDTTRRGQADHFPFKDLKGLYEGDPRKLFDENGNVNSTKDAQKIIGNGDLPAQGEDSPVVNAKKGLTVGKIREIASDLEAQNRQERKSVTSPFTQGDPKALGWNSKVLQVLNQAIDGALDRSGSGNTATYRLATAATGNYYRSMHQGVVGSILGRNLEGGDGGIASPQTLQKLIPGGINGAAATRQLFDVIHQQNQLKAGTMGGADPNFPQQPTPHPADTLAQGIENHLRSEYGNAFTQGGPGAGQTFRENNAIALRAFPQLDKDMDASIASGKNLLQTQQASKDFDKTQEQSAAALYAGGDIGKAIQGIVKSPDPGAEMARHLDAAAADHTGAAPRGIAKAFFDRMRSEGVNPITHEYEPGGVARFYDANKQAFGELANRGLIDRNSLSQIVQSFRESDKLRADPATMLKTPQSSQFSLAWLANKAFGVGGAKAGRAMHTGTIQVPGMMAHASQEVGNAMFSKLSSAGAKNLQADLLFDRDKFQAFLQAGHMASRGAPAMMQSLLSPYVKAFPAIAAEQANKQFGPQTQPDSPLP